MANTLATRKQSEAIRARMKQIRTDLPYDVDVARQQVRQLTDWRYQFRKRPAVIMAAAAVVGYLLVPHSRKEREIVVHTSDGDRMASTKPAKRGFVSGLVATAAAMALKSGTSMLTNHLSQTLFDQTPSGKPGNSAASLQSASGNSTISEVS